MSIRFTSSSSENLRHTTPISSAYGDITISAWVYAAGLSGATFVAGIQKSSSVYDGRWLGFNGAYPMAYVYDYGAVGTTEQHQTSCSTSTWYHVVGCFDGNGSNITSMYTYLDGVVDSSYTTGRTLGISTPGVLTIAARQNSGTPAFTGFFNGTIAEVCVWSVLLTAEEVNSLYNRISPKLIRPNSLEFYAPLDRGIGISQPEFIGNRTGTEYNTPTVGTTFFGVFAPNSIIIPEKITSTSETNITATTKSISITEYNATVIADNNITTSAKSIVITKYNATISTLTDSTIDATTKNISITKYNSTIEALSNTVITTTTKAINITLLDATIVTGSASEYYKNNNLILDSGYGICLILGGSRISTWNNSGKPSIPKKGTIGYNSDTSEIELYTGSTWKTVSLT